MSLPRSVACGIIAGYQHTFSRDHGVLRGYSPAGFCRFSPSCSEYARQAILHYGVLRGGLLALWRLGRCHPWSRGGVDPVP